MHNYKLLIASGCSYTAGSWNWPDPLAKLLNTQLNNYGTLSVGNGKISRSVIYGVLEALKTYKPEEILVGIVWSGNNRREFYQAEVDKSDIHTKGTENPHGFIESKQNWVTVNHHWSDVYSTNYYKYFYDRIDSEIITLEHILRTQWFLEKHNVKYFMSTFAPNVLPINVDDNTKHLLELVNFDRFLKVKSIMEWCIEESGLPIQTNDIGRPITDMHPSVEHSKKFAKEIMLPFINTL